jgi:hypothetical protein
VTVGFGFPLPLEPTSHALAHLEEPEVVETVESEVTEAVGNCKNTHRLSEGDEANELVRQENVPCSARGTRSRWSYMAVANSSDCRRELALVGCV